MENIFWLIALPVAIVLLIMNPIAMIVPFVIFVAIMVYRKWTAGDRSVRAKIDPNDYHW